MYRAKGQVAELILEGRYRHTRIACPPHLVPLPGQYLLAGYPTAAEPGFRACSPLPASLFYTDSAPEGFIAATSVAWDPCVELDLRGPLGRGFTLPVAARRVALIALEESPVYLRGVIASALKQEAAVVLVSDSGSDLLPDEVEVQPLSLLDEIVDWADYLALDVRRESLDRRKVQVRRDHRLAAKDAQILVHTPVACGGMAECGACAVILRSGWKLGCKDGPVFAWRELR